MILRKALLKNRLIILSSLFLILLVSFGVASFSANVTTLAFGGDNFEHTVGDNEILTLSNSYVNYSIENLDFNFVSNGSFGSFNFGFVFPFNGESILNSSSNATSVELTIPKGIDAIDSEFKEVAWNVGEINISGTANNITNMTIQTFGVSEIFPVTVQVENNLEFYSNKVQVEVDGEDADNISDGNTVDAYVGDDVEIIVSYKNTFSNDSFKFEDNDIQIILFVDDRSYGEEASTGEDDVLGEEVGVARELTLDLSDYDVAKYNIRLELTGEIDGGLHGEIFEFKLNVKEEPVDSPLDSDGDGVNDDVDVCPIDHVPGCIVEVDGCDLDSDGDGVCDGWDQTPNGTEEEEEEEEVLETDNSDEEQEEETEKEEKKDEPKETPWPFVFGLIVGVVGAALFFVLTKF